MWQPDEYVKLEKLKAELKLKPTCDIVWFRARYCTPANNILSFKIHHCQVPLKWIDELIFERQFTEELEKTLTDSK